MEKYTYILFNADTLASDTLEALLFDLELYYLAKFLKTKFHDKRSILELQELIVLEYTLPKGSSIHGLRKTPQ